MPVPARLRRLLRNDETHFVDLTRHFFDRFFDAELISKDAEAHLGVAHILALLSIPGVVYAIFAFFAYSYVYWHFTQALYDAVSISDQCRYVLFSMVVVGMAAVLEWDRLFPDSRDYTILTPLPLKVRTIFCAKAAALLLFVSLFLLAVAGIPVIFYPLMAVWGLRPDASFPHFALMIAAHAIAVFSGCLFIFLFFVALQGVLINLLSAGYFKKISVWIQGLATVALICLFFLLPVVPSLLPRWERSGSRLLFALPFMWFLGLYQTILGSHNPLFTALARIALIAFGLVMLTAAAAYWACYKRHSQMALEAPAGRLQWRVGFAMIAGRLLNRLAVKEGRERATFYFVLKTLARSAKHRLYFVAYVSAGLGLVLVGIFEMMVHSMRGGIWAPLSRPDAAMLSIPLVVSFFMLSGMRIVFGFPAELRANWIFQITDDGDGRACMAGARKAMLAVAVAPLFALMLALCAVFWGILASAGAVLFSVFLSLVLTEILLVSFRKIPFTCSYQPGKANLPALGALYWLAFAFYAYSLALLEQWALHEPLRWIAVVGAECATLAYIVQLRKRASADGIRFQYEDDPLPAIQSLSLNS